MKKTTRISCAIVGYGYWGHIVEKYLINSEFFHLKYICSPRYTNTVTLKSLLQDRDLDAIYVCTPIDTHYEITKAALQHGKHVFCEKPLSKSLIEAKELVSLAYSKNLCLYTDYIYTVSPSINFLREHISLLGNISFIHGEILQFGNFYKNDSVQEVLGAHLFSAILYILDSLEIPQILDYYPIHTSTYKSEAAVMLLRLSSVPRINIICSLVSAIRSRKIIIEGSNGTLIFNPLGEYTAEMILIKRGDEDYVIQEKEQVFFDENNNLNFVIADFYNQIQNPTPVPRNISLSLIVTSLIDELNKYH